MSTEEPHKCLDPDEQIAKTRLTIEKYGLQVIMLQATGYLPSFAYSIGLWQSFGHPEVICFGMKTDTMHVVINDIADMIRQGDSIVTGRSYDNIFQESPVEYIKVDPSNVSDYFGAAINYYGNKDFPAIQLVWADRNKKFPWEEGFEEVFRHKQPLLDRNTAFKFLEAKNLGIFTTKQWLDLNKPILRVVHEHDGDWQFLTGGQSPGDIALVALEQMTLQDPTLNEVFDLDYGQVADRSHIGGKWTRSEMQEAAEEEEEDRIE